LSCVNGFMSSDLPSSVSATEAFMELSIPGVRKEFREAVSFLVLFPQVRCFLLSDG
jgi:hypothetical protein